MKRYIKSTEEDFIVDTPKDLDEAYKNYKAVKISKHMPKEKQAELRKQKAGYKKQMDELRKKHRRDAVEGSSDFIMSHEDKFDIIRLMDIAESQIRAMLKSCCKGNVYYEVDDVKWGKDCFEIPIFKGYKSRPPFGDTKQIDAFRFCYDPEDVFDRSAEEQLEDKLSDFLDSFQFVVESSY